MKVLLSNCFWLFCFLLFFIFYLGVHIVTVTSTLVWNNVKPQESAGLHSHFVRYDDFCYVLVIKQTATQKKYLSNS